MQKQISELEQKAESNINENKSKVELSEAELEGLPENEMSKLKPVPGKAGYKIVKLEKNFIGQVTKHLKLESTRKKLNYAQGQVNKAENVPILDKLVQLRHEMALVLGYSSYSELILENKMAKNPVAV